MNYEPEKKAIGVVTSARSDFNSLRPVLEGILAHPRLHLNLYVTGMHLCALYGNTINQIKESGIPITAQVDMLLCSGSPGAMAKSMAIGTIGFAQVFENHAPDILLVLGDRFETYCAVTAALPFNIAIAHLRGGEVTAGAIDESFRHSISKMSHLHFTANHQSARRLMRMGEEPWRITPCGDPGLETIEQITLPSPRQLEEQFKIDFSKPVLLITFHPVTLEYQKTAQYIDNLLIALTPYTEYHLVFTYPNADTHGGIIIEKLTDFEQQHENAFLVPNFGREGFYGMLKYAAAMVGNSSAGIWESSSFRIPVVNIGNRQAGRLRAANVIDCPPDTPAISRAIDRAVSPAFRQSLENLENPYVGKNAAESILEKLASVPLDDKLFIKRFYDGDQAI